MQQEDKDSFRFSVVGDGDSTVFEIERFCFQRTGSVFRMLDLSLVSRGSGSMVFHRRSFLKRKKLTDIGFLVPLRAVFLRTWILQKLTGRFGFFRL